MVEPISDAAGAMHTDDLASRGLGIAVVSAEPGEAIATMVVHEDHCNGLGVCHGGLIFTLADTAMAYATNAAGERAFATHAEIDFVNAARAGDHLTATCRRVVERGRAGVSDVVVRNKDDQVIALFRGRTLATR